MVKLLGHRGVYKKQRLDENSLPALKKAFEQADGVETDISVSKDGTAYLVHDVSLLRLSRYYARPQYVLPKILDKKSVKTAGKKRIDQMGDDEIDALRLKHGQTIARLSDLFTLAAGYKGKILNLEMKGENSASATVAETERAIKSGLVDKAHVVLSSFNIGALEMARSKDPAIKCGMLIGPPDIDGVPIYPWSGNKSCRYSGYSEAFLKSPRLKNINPDYFILPDAMISKTIVGQIRGEYPDARFMVWCTREKKPHKNKIIEKLKKEGLFDDIDMVITNYPPQYKKRLDGGLRPS